MISDSSSDFASATSTSTFKARTNVKGAPKMGPNLLLNNMTLRG
jgi:hypothetical protein